MKNIVSFSGGKDSTAMVHAMLERGETIDKIIFFDGGWEFPEMYDHIDMFENKTGLKVTRLKPEHPFDYYLSEWLKQLGKWKGEKGRGWPYIKNRWCTGLKTTAISRYVRNFSRDIYEMCIGLAKDEHHRTERGQGSLKLKKRYPLIEYGMTEQDCLKYCYDLGYKWGGGVSDIKQSILFLLSANWKTKILSIIRQQTGYMGNDSMQKPAFNR